MSHLPAQSARLVRDHAEVDALRDLADGTPKPPQDVLRNYGRTLGLPDIPPDAADEIYAASYIQTRFTAA